MNTKEIREAINLYDYNKMSQEQLQEIALNHTNLFVRYYAISHLTDQKALEKIALNVDEYPVFREQAVQLITSTDILKQIFLTDNVWSVQLEALKRLSKLEDSDKIILCTSSDFENKSE